MIKEKLAGIVINLKNNISHQEYCSLINEIWKEITSPSNRHEFKEELLEIFYKLVVSCKELEQIKEKDIYIVQVFQELVDFFKDEINSEIQETEYRRIYLYFLKFLYLLQNEKHEELDQSINVFAYNLMDNISDFNHLFHLKDNGKYIFSLDNLILIVTDRFEKKNDDLLTLTFTVSLKSDREVEDNKDDDAQKKLNSIINDNELEYLNYMLNKNGRIICNSDWVDNYKCNNTIIVANEDTILIRNTTKSYFSGFDNIKKEKLAQPGYYVEIPKNGLKFTDAYNFIMDSNDIIDILFFVKRTLINGYYNIFLSESILVDPLDGKFNNVLNQFSNNDSQIIFSENHMNFESTLTKYLECLKFISRNNVKYIIKSNEFNFISFNYFIEVISIFEKKELILKYIENLEELLNKNLISNYHQVAEICFYKTVEEAEISLKEIDTLLSKYVSITENIMIQKDVNNQLIHSLPVKSSHDFLHEEWQILKKIYYFKHKKESALNEDYKYGSGIIEADSSDIVSLRTDVGEFSSIDFDFIYLSEDLETIDNSNELSSVTNKLLINSEKKEIIILPTTIGSIIENYKILRRLYEKGISYEYLQKMKSKIVDIKKIANIIESAGDFNNLLYFYHRKDANEISKEFALLYKIIIHLKNYSISVDKLDNWIKLILQYHYIEPALLKNHIDIINKFFSKCKQEYLSGALIIPLKTISHDSTLRKIYEKYYTVGNNRDGFGFIFDSMQLSEKIKRNEDDGKYYIKTNNHEKLINKIIFISDIIMTGQAVEKILNKYFGKNNSDSSSFIKDELVFIDNLNNILEVNTPKIMIGSIFCDKNRNEFLAGNDDREIKVEVDRTFNMIEFDKDIYWYEPKATNKIYSLYTELYGNRIIEAKDFCCMIRYNNMPQKFLPKITDKSNKYSIDNLFIRKQSERL